MMKSSGPIVTSLFLAILFGLTAIAFADEQPGEQPSACLLENKTFDRWPDPVVADCGLFSTMLGKKIEFVRVYVHTKGSFHPIPFQIDEKDGQGNRVYPSGEKANPEDGNGLMDKGEELVFMARDCGNRVKPDIFPTGIELWEELELSDSLTQGKGWVYLLYSEKSPPPLSQEDYIINIPVHKCEGEGDCNFVKSKYLEDHLYPMEPYFDMDDYPDAGYAHMFMSTTPEGGGTGVDIVDRVKGRTTFAMLFGLIKYRIDENDMNFYEAAYKDGPVRLLRNFQVIISFPGFKAPGVAVEVIWYDTIINVPMVIDIPMNPGYVITYMETKIGEDRAPGAIGMKVYNSNNLKGCLVDGKMEGEAELNWNTDRDEWRLTTGKQGTIMNRSFWDEKYLTQMEWVKVEYFDDLSTEDPPEEEPGMLGMIVQTNRVENIKKDRYHSYLEWYWPPSFLFSGPDQTYLVGDEKVYLNIADHPVKLRAGKLSMESHYFGQMPNYEQAEKIIQEKRKDASPLKAE